MDDSELIQATLDGNHEAFGQLVDRYQDRLFNTIAYVAGSADEAEDIVQDAFLQAFSKLQSYAGRSSFFTWLYRIAFNNAISRKRRKKILLWSVTATFLRPRQLGQCVGCFATIKDKR